MSKCNKTKNHSQAVLKRSHSRYKSFQTWNSVTKKESDAAIEFQEILKLYFIVYDHQLRGAFSFTLLRREKSRGDIRQARHCITEMSGKERNCIYAGHVSSSTNTEASEFHSPCLLSPKGARPALSKYMYIPTAASNQRVLVSESPLKKSRLAENDSFCRSVKWQHPCSQHDNFGTPSIRGSYRSASLMVWIDPMTTLGCLACMPFSTSSWRRKQVDNEAIIMKTIKPLNDVILLAQLPAFQFLYTSTRSPLLFLLFSVE